MRYFPFLLIFVFFKNYSQCHKETNVQYNDGMDSYSYSKKVSVTFGKGSEISNSYNYINFEQESLYCVIYGFDTVYNVKLFSSYSSIYATGCSSITSVFRNGYIKGKDQEGRIWKIYKPTESTYNRPVRKYNKTESSINEKELNRTLTVLDKKYENEKYKRNYKALNDNLDILIGQTKLLTNKIEQLGNPSSLVVFKDEIRNYGNNCIRNINYNSDTSTIAALDCLMELIPKLDALKLKIDDYR